MNNIIQVELAGRIHGYCTHCTLTFLIKTDNILKEETENHHCTNCGLALRTAYSIIKELNDLKKELDRK